MEKELQTRLIVNLIKIKNGLLTQAPLDPRTIYPNYTFCVLETIIATLIDKYNLRPEDIKKYLASPAENK